MCYLPMMLPLRSGAKSLHIFPILRNTELLASFFFLNCTGSFLWDRVNLSNSFLPRRKAVRFNRQGDDEPLGPFVGHPDHAPHSGCPCHPWAFIPAPPRTSGLPSLLLGPLPGPSEPSTASPQWALSRPSV